MDRPSCSDGALFDLSRYDIPFQVNWPAPPITSRIIEVDTCTEFQSAVRNSNALINVASGTYSSCNLSVTGDDLDIVMSNNATLHGTVTMETSGGTAQVERLRWTGGNIIAPTQMTWRAVQDVLINDVRVLGSIILQKDTLLDDGVNRIAFMNSTIDGRNGSFPFPLQSGYDASTRLFEDTIIVNCLMLGNANTPIRLQGQLRTIVIESYFSGMGGDGSMLTGFRIGEASEDLFVGGTSSKPTIIVGRVKLDYIELQSEDYAIINSVWDGVDRYNTPDGGGAAFLNVSANSGVVRNMRSYFTNGIGSLPYGISPFTTGANVANVQA